MCKLTKVADLQIFKRKSPSEKLDKTIGVMFLEVGKDSKVFKTIYFSRIFFSDGMFTSTVYQERMS